MMRRILIASMLSAWIPGAAVWAHDYHEDMGDQPGTTGEHAGTKGEQAGTTDEVTTTSTTEVTETKRGYLTSEMVGIKPQVGAMVFQDQLGNNTARAAYGVTVDGNVATSINKDWSHLFIGPSTGAIFSHLGDPSSNFVGANPTTNIGSAGANTLLIPANLKVGYNFTDNFRLAAHGGGNVLYRSVANSLSLGDSSATTASNWSIFPNVGADAEFSLGKNVAVMLRPDWTMTPGNDFFTGTVAMSIPLG